MRPTSSRGITSRIARLQRFVRQASRAPQRGLAELAASAGYVDQPHLAKDCRAIVSGRIEGDKFIASKFEPKP